MALASRVPLAPCPGHSLVCPGSFNVLLQLSGQCLAVSASIALSIVMTAPAFGVSIPRHASPADWQYCPRRY